MGAQGSMGGNKPGRPPNANYGSGAALDNSNGVYNAAAFTNAQAQGLGATGTTGGQSGYAAPGAGGTGATPTDLGNYDATYGATGANYTAQPGATGTTSAYTGPQPQKGGAKGAGGPQPLGTMQQQQAGYNMTAEQALAAGGPQQTPYSSYSGLPPPPVNTTPPQSSPISGTNMNFGTGGKGGAKGGTPGAPMGTVGDLLSRLGIGGGQQQLSGQAQAQANTGQPIPIPGTTGTTGTTGPTAPPAPGVKDASNWWQYDPNAVPKGGVGGFGASIKAKDAQAKAMYDASPQWAKNMLSGVGSDGSTNESRAQREIDDPTTRGLAQSGTGTDWEAAVRQMTGEPDAWEAMRKLGQVARTGGGKYGGGANVRRALEASGLSPGVAARVHELFFSGGGDAESAAQRLGVKDEYQRRGGMEMQKAGYDPTKYAGTAAATKAMKNVNSAWVTGTPESGKPPPGPPEATGATGPPEDTGTTGATGPTAPPDAGVVTPEEAATTPGLTNDRVAQIAKSYGVSPEIAKQIYKAILQQSQGSGGGDTQNSGSGGDGGSGGGD